jgi:5'-nucleotidase
MAYELTERLVVGVASSALFDLTESDAYFRKHGEAAYRTYQDEHLDDQLPCGVAFPFIQRLLQLNDLRPDSPLVEVIVLSRNDPDTGLRVMRSVASHGLLISRAIFTQGRAPYDYLGALEISLFLSAHRPDVDEAIRLGFPAGHVLPSQAEYDDDQSLVVAFDFDGVLADDESERRYRDGGLGPYQQHESIHKLEALGKGPLQPLLADLNKIQSLEEAKRAEDADYTPRLRIALVTARNAPAHERTIRSLRDWGVRVNDVFFLGGIEKARVLQVMRPHIFFDDQMTHLKGTGLDDAAVDIVGVHIPYGIANETEDSTETEEES